MAGRRLSLPVRDPRGQLPPDQLPFAARLRPPPCEPFSLCFTPEAAPRRGLFDLTRADICIIILVAIVLSVSHRVARLLGPLPAPSFP